MKYKMKRKCLISSDDVILSTTSDPDSSMNNSNNFSRFCFFFFFYFSASYQAKENTPFYAVLLRESKCLLKAAMQLTICFIETVTIFLYFPFETSDGIIEIIIQRRVAWTLRSQRVLNAQRCRLKSLSKEKSDNNSDRVVIIQLMNLYTYPLNINIFSFLSYSHSPSLCQRVDFTINNKRKRR